MGLDMYLKGEAFYPHDHPNRKAEPFPMESTTYRLGYWRKHPNLHGFIVKTFADGTDECQQIDMSAENLRVLIQAVERDALPETNGFFFGKSDGSEKPDDLRVLSQALEWLEAKQEGEWRSVRYRASW